MNNYIGNNIRILRESAGYTQKNIADFMKVDQSLISKIEKGERSLTTDMLDRLSALFGIPEDQILEGPVVKSKLSFAFRGSDLSLEDMEAVCAINKIALNSEMMRVILKGERK